MKAKAPPTPAHLLAPHSAASLRSRPTCCQLLTLPRDLLVGCHQAARHPGHICISADALLTPVPEALQAAPRTRPSRGSPSLTPCLLCGPLPSAHLRHPGLSSLL